MNKPEFFVHELLLRLGVDNVEVLGIGGPIISQNVIKPIVWNLCWSKIMKPKFTEKVSNGMVGNYYTDILFYVSHELFEQGQ